MTMIETQSRQIENGIHKITKGDYHADPCGLPSLSASIARIAVAQSPAHAWLAHPRGGAARSESSDVMRTGTLIDSLLLGGDTEIVKVAANDWRTNAAKEARAAAEADGKIAVLAHQLGAAERAAAAIRDKIAAVGVRLDGEHQLTAVWSETAENGQAFQARARFDHLSADGLTIYDLKITGDANPAGPKLARHCVDFGYDIQAHAYVRALGLIDPARSGRVRFVNVWAEPAPPYAVLVTVPGGTMRELGARRWQQAVNAWGVGLATGYWRAYAEPGSPPVGIEAPPWTLDDAALVGGSQGITF